MGPQEREEIRAIAMLQLKARLVVWCRMHEHDLVITSYSIHYTKLYDTGLVKHLRDIEPFLSRKSNARGLFAVAKRGVVNDNCVCVLDHGKTSLPPLKVAKYIPVSMTVEQTPLSLLFCLQKLRHRFLRDLFDEAFTAPIPSILSDKTTEPTFLHYTPQIGCRGKGLAPCKVLHYLRKK